MMLWVLLSRYCSGSAMFRSGFHEDSFLSFQFRPMAQILCGAIFCDGVVRRFSSIVQQDIIQYKIPVYQPHWKLRRLAALAGRT